MNLSGKMRAALVAIAAAPAASLPPLGDPAKRYWVELTEPEINAIHAAFGFLAGAGVSAPFAGLADHYAPTMRALSERLGIFDDGNAPATGRRCRPQAEIEAFAREVQARIDTESDSGTVALLAAQRSTLLWILQDSAYSDPPRYVHGFSAR